MLNNSRDLEKTIIKRIENESEYTCNEYGEIDEDSVLIIETERVKKIINETFENVRKGGDVNVK